MSDPRPDDLARCRSRCAAIAVVPVVALVLGPGALRALRASGGRADDRGRDQPSAPTRV